MSYSPIVVANGFLDLAEGARVPPMTNMKVQKLVYIAHGFTLAMCDEPLISSHVHAFQWGPVIPLLYEALKQFGPNPIPGPIDLPENEEPFDPSDPTAVDTAIVRGVWDRYGKLSAMQLSNITHKEGTPWDVTWKRRPYGIIPDEVIQGHYLGLIQKGL